MDVTPLPADRFRQLVEGAAAVAGQTDLTSVLYTTIETAMELTGAQYGALGVLDEDGGLLEFLHLGLPPEAAEAIGHEPEGLGLLGMLTRKAQTVRTDSIADHPDSVGFPPHHPTMETFLGVPVRLGSEVYGNLYLTEKEQGFSIQDERLVEGIAVIAGSAINTARMQRRLRRLAIVEDRERIARDLHDAIIQDLFAVGLSLQAQTQKVVEPEVAKVIAETVERLDETIASLRRFIFDLRPPVWSRRDLRAEVSDLIGHLAEPYPTVAQMTFDGQLDDLPPTMVDDALQLISEAVSNALRHANTDHIHVSIQRDRDEIMLSVVDEGTGFDPTAPTAGMGLENIRTRASRAGGEATVVSATGTGTTVRIRIPV